MARMTKADIIESVYEKVGGYGKTKPRSEGKLPFDKP